MLGIQCTDTSVQAARVTGTRKHGAIKKYKTEKISKGTLERGVVLDSEKLADALKKVTKGLGGTSVALCLPPETVYCTLLHIAPSRGKRFQELLNTAIAETIPEERQVLRYKTHILKRTSDGIDVAIVAIRSDVLEGYLEACKKARLRVVSVTTTSFGCNHLVSKNTVTILTSVGLGTYPTITLFQNGWPVDEATLPISATDASLAKEIQNLMQKPHTQSMKYVTVLGSEKLLKYLRGALNPKKKKGESKENVQNQSVTAMIPWLKEKDLPFAGACIACWSQSSAMNLLRSENAGKNVRAILALLLVLGFCAVAIAYLRPDLIPTLS